MSETFRLEFAATDEPLVDLLEAWQLAASRSIDSPVEFLWDRVPEDADDCDESEDSEPITDFFFVFNAGGSSRGVTIVEESDRPGELQVKMSHLASRIDWRLCFLLLREIAAKRGAEIRDENGVILPPESLTEERAVERFTERMRTGIRAMRAVIESDAASLRIPVHNVGVMITGEDLRRAETSADPVGEMERTMVANVEKFLRARPAPVRKLADGRTATLWIFKPAIVPRVDVIMIPGADPNDPATSPGDVPLHAARFDDLLAALGDRAERVWEKPERFYLPGVDAAVIARILGR